MQVDPGTVDAGPGADIGGPGGAETQGGARTEPRRTSPARRWMGPAGEALLPFVLARVIVLGVLALAHFIVDRTDPSHVGVAARVHEGLLGWDAGFYETIARVGYGAMGMQSLRFYPAVPALTHAVAWLPGVGDGTALLVVSNVAADVATVLLYILVRRETRNTLVARRAIWFLSLAPAAYVLVMGYAESTLLCLAIGCFLALRPSQGPLPDPKVDATSQPEAAMGRHAAGRWRVAMPPADAGPPTDAGPPADAMPPADAGLAADAGPAGAGAPASGTLPASAEVPASGIVPPNFVLAGVLAFLAAVTRPIGVLLALAVAVELLRWWARLRAGRRLAGVGATVAPVVGLAAFGLWSRHEVGDFWAPLSVQFQSKHHGALADPVVTLYHDVRGLWHGHVGTGLHVPWVVLALILLIVCCRKLPASYTVFSAAVLLVAVAGSNLDLFERYALSAFPLTIAAALTAGSRSLSGSCWALLPAALAAYALLAFLNISVP